MVKKVCVNADGKCYVDNPKALETPEKLHLSEYQAQKLKASLEPFMKRFYLPETYVGLDKIAVKHNDGTYTPIYEEKKTLLKAKLPPALCTVLKNTRGR